ncbi:hypothetical protein HYT55_04470 [Candidatus Woesearchaeota archaeon]|nr:hypothetical protein [Candidatus Woesearchaeota archaeon]
MIQREVKKTIIVAIVLLVFLMVAGCFNYKQADAQPDEQDILKEIAKVEQEVSAEAPKTETVSVEATTKSVEENKTVEEVVSLPAPTASAATTDAPATQPTQPTTEKSVEAESEMQTIKVKENDKIRLIVQLRDPDNDTINYTYTQPLNGMGEWKTNYGDAGEYVSTLTVTDGQLTTKKKIKLVVERVNVAPVIEPVHDVTVNEGETVKFVAVVKDPNNDKVTVTVSDPLKEGEFKTDHTSAGEYNINVAATDGELSSEKSFKLVVKDVNVPPEINGVQDMTVKEGSLVTLTPVITDIDNDNIKVTISNPVGDDGVWQTAYTDHGDYIITITADDGKAKVSKQIKLVVADVNMPPEIVKINLQK